MSTLSYNGFIGSIEVSEKDNCLFGEVLGLPNNVKITYEGETVAELRDDFIGAVDDYLADCSARGVLPKRSYKGAFNVRVSPELHAQLDALAQMNGLSLNKYINNALSMTASKAMQF
ncbi:MAG: type II toxin-antitoxin system HicB family antitoxin [Paludibacteraceae bacterium]|nr:type II toxin-antitoxin system HicB family antitoxin [Paludibacteraceae bacterium]